jgi:hypothetical protein
MNAARRLVVTLVVPALMLAVFAVNIAAAGGPNGKTTVCHLSSSWFHAITISNSALPAHLQHGDVAPDDYGACP